MSVATGATKHESVRASLAAAPSTEGGAHALLSAPGRGVLRTLFSEQQAKQYNGRYNGR